MPTLVDRAPWVLFNRPWTSTFHILNAPNTSHQHPSVAGLEVLLLRDTDGDKESNSNSAARHKSSEDEYGDSFQMSDGDSGGESGVPVFPPRPTGEPARVRSLVSRVWDNVRRSLCSPLYLLFRSGRFCCALPFEKGN